MNPILPIIVRECDGTRAKVFARYGMKCLISFHYRLQQYEGSGFGWYDSC